VAALVLMWAVAVPLAAALGVLALRAAGGDSSGAAVLSASEAEALVSASPAATASASPSPSTGPTPTPTPAPTPAPTDALVVERRVPGAVLGLSCAATGPVLVWSVPDPGWRVDEVEPEDGELRVRLESEAAEIRVIIACTDATPEVVEAARSDDD
jgi:hypothetical protein